MNSEFDNPKISINKVYTRKGDNGNTSLVGGEKVKKYSDRICAFGEIDELNAHLGLCSINKDVKKIKIRNKLFIIQNDLFNLGNMLATPDNYMIDSCPKITQSSIRFLEENIDFYNKELDALSSFILPGGSKLSVEFHLARVVCRRCERLIVEVCEKENIDLIVVGYLNRLSDLLFVLGRYSNVILGDKEVLWNPNYSKE